MDLYAYFPSQTALRVAAQFYLRGLYREITAKNLFLWAQAIAFKVLVTLVPILILATGLAGRLLQREDSFASVIRFIHDFLPPSQSGQVVEFLDQLQQASATIVGLGGLGLFLSAVSLFITLRIAVGNAFEQEWHDSRSMVGGYLFDVRMVLQVGVLFLLTLSLSVVAQSMQFPALLQQLGVDAPWLLEGWQRTISTLGLFVPFLVTTAMFFQLYYFVPTPHPRKRSAFLGAFIAGLLWEAAKQAFTWYATYFGGFDNVAVLGNTFGLIIAFVFWVYFSGIVLMIGAVIASLHEHRHVASGRLPGEPPPEDKEMSAETKEVETQEANGTASGDGVANETELTEAAPRRPAPDADSPQRNADKPGGSAPPPASIPGHATRSAPDPSSESSSA